MRGIPVLCALVAAMVASSGCGSAAPRHGILLTHDGDLYLRQPHRTQPRRLTNSPGGDDEPAWSPNGKRIAFTRTSCGNDPECDYEVFVADSDGGGRALTSPD